MLHALLLSEKNGLVSFADTPESAEMKSECVKLDKAIGALGEVG